MLLSKTLNNSGPELLFSIAFVFTVETGFIPISLASHFKSVNSNIELANMINGLPLDSFWHQNSNIFHAGLLISNQLCYLTGVPLPNGDSLITTLSHSNTSKCILLKADDIDLNKTSVCFSQLSLKYKNLVSVPIKCSVLEITTGHYPGLCGIPAELILYIMKKLKAPDVYTLMRCCKKMNYFAKNNQSLWKKFVIEEFPEQYHNSKFTYMIMGSLLPINDWRKLYYSLKKDKHDKNRIQIIRE